MRRMLLGWTCFALASLGSNLVAKEPYFHIQVVDAETGRGVPLVELETVNNIQLVTDSAGNIAFLEPGLMDREVFFRVHSHGYEYPKDGFGFRGVRDVYADDCEIPGCQFKNVGAIAECNGLPAVGVRIRPETAEKFNLRVHARTIGAGGLHVECFYSNQTGIETKIKTADTLQSDMLLLEPDWN